MKTLITFTILFFLYGDIQKKYVNAADFIVITHTGMEEKPIRGLIISTRSINLDELPERFYGSDSHTSKGKYYSLNLRYNLSVTDKRTYQSIIDFVSNNKSFFTDSIRMNHGDYDDYSVTVKGTSYNIFYRSKDEFFKNMIKYLQRKKCDQRLVANLGFY